MGAPEWIARFQGLLASAAHLQTAVLHAAEHLPGFQFAETMRGTVSFAGTDTGLPAGERRIVLDLHAQAESLGGYLREGSVALSGTASIDGVVASAPVTGSIWIWPHRQIVRYELSFPAAGRSLQFAGQKDVRLLDFRYTMATLPAKLYDEHGHEAGSATVEFDWADLPAFLRSFRRLPA